MSQINVARKSGYWEDFGQVRCIYRIKMKLIEFTVSAWNSSLTSKDIASLERILKLAIHIIFGQDYRSSNSGPTRQWAIRYPVASDFVSIGKKSNINWWFSTFKASHIEIFQCSIGSIFSLGYPNGIKFTRINISHMVSFYPYSFAQICDNGILRRKKKTSWGWGVPSVAKLELPTSLKLAIQ